MTNGAFEDFSELGQSIDLARPSFIHIGGELMST